VMSRIFHSEFNREPREKVSVREDKTVEIGSHLLVLIRTLAAALWISWRLFRDVLGQLSNKELQSSNLEVAN